MRKIIIAGKEYTLKDEKATIRCPKCARKIPHGFIKKAYTLLGKKIQRDKAFYVELGLKGMAKRWGKSYEHLKKMHSKHEAKKGRSQ